MQKAKERKTKETKHINRQAVEQTGDPTKHTYQLKSYGTYFCHKLDLKPVALTGK